MSLERIKQIRDVFSYSKRFRQQTFIIYFDDALLQSNELHSLIYDAQQLLQAQIKIVIVPDIQATVEHLFSQFGRSHDFLYNSNTAVEEEDIELLQSAVFETTGKLLAIFARHKQAAAVGNWVAARGKGVVKNQDLLYAGNLEKIDLHAINTLLENSIIPIFPALGWSQKIKPYYLSAIDLASQLSAVLGASKLIYVRNANLKQVISELDLEKNDTRLDYSEDGVAARMTMRGALEILQEQKKVKKEKNNSLQMLSSAAQALERGVERVHFLDGTVDGALLIEIFFDQGIGFMVHSDEYRAIATVKEDEIEVVHELMLPFIKKGTLIFRDRDLIRKTLKDYVAYKVDGEIYGVAALHQLDATSAEIAGVAVQARYDNFGIGKRLVQYLLRKAKQNAFSRVFCLTKSIGDWLELMGFAQVPPQELPRLRYSEYRKMARNSRVYAHTIKDATLE